MARRNWLPIWHKRQENRLIFFFDALFKGEESYKYSENKITGGQFFKWASEKLDNKFTPHEINLMWVSEYVEIPGIRNIIIDLKKKGIKVSVLSDNVPERINYLEDHFKNLFDDIVLSYEVNLTKPSGEIFQLALKS